MKTRIFILACMLSSVATVNATIVQNIVLKDGSILKGFIKQQDNAGRLVCQTDEALIITGTNAAISNMQEYKLADLDAKWTNWAKHNGENKDMITLCDVSANGVLHNKVCILEKGAVVKFYEIGTREYTVEWSSVARIVADRRPKLQMTGVNVTYTTRTGAKISGQYAGETDSTLSVYTQNYTKESLRIDDVVKYNYGPQNANQTIFEQSELLDVVSTSNGSTWKGVVIERNYTDDINDCIIIATKGGGNVSIKNTDIQHMSREVNPEYACITDIILDADSVVLNRMAIGKGKMQSVGELFVLDALPKQACAVEKAKNGATQLIVEYANNGNNNERFKLAKATQVNVKKVKAWTIKKDDLINSSASHVGNIETSVNGTTKATYQTTETGLFMLFDNEHKIAYPFVIK